jgi:C_GCAxxG_C_C family probable redox protein
MHPNEKASQLFATGYSCSQSLLVSRAAEFGLSTETALKVSAAFGGGLGREGEICGAVSGALMVIGLANGQTTPEDKTAKERTYQLTRQLIAEFTRRKGSIRCCDLLGCQIGTPDGLRQAQEQNLFKTVCPGLVAEASEILTGMLDEN